MHQHTQALLQVTGVNANSILSQRERVSHPIGQSYHDLPKNWFWPQYLSESNRSGMFVSYKHVLVHEFARPHSFANCFFWVLI